MEKRYRLSATYVARPLTEEEVAMSFEQLRQNHIVIEPDTTPKLGDMVVQHPNEGRKDVLHITKEEFEREFIEVVD